MRQSSLVVVANRLPVDDSAGARMAPASGGAAPAGWPAPCTPILAAHPGHLGRLGRRRRAGAQPCRTSTACGCTPSPLAAEDVARLLRGVRQLHAVAALPRRRRAAGLPPRAGGRPTSGSTGASPRRPPRSPSPAPWSGCRTTTCNWCPAMLRELRPDLLIGFFLHVPFPPPELFMQLPRRAELLRGMLGADLVGFQRAAGRAQLRPARRQGARAARHRPPDRGGRPDRADRRVPGLHRHRRDGGAGRPPGRGQPRPRSCAPTWASRGGCCSASTGWTTPRASSSGSRRTASCSRERPGQGRATR